MNRCDIIHPLEDYRYIIDDETISRLYQDARPLYDVSVVTINSTTQGGGVAEILNSLTPLLNDIGVEFGWRVIPGSPDFFVITKKFHNGLQGEQINLTDMKKCLYQDFNSRFAKYTHIDHGCVIVHDPQPLPLISYYRKSQPWIWRCHVDLSNPNRDLWDYLKGFILRYDLVVVSHKDYIQPDLPVEQRVIHPAIDPLCPKNRPMGKKVIDRYLKKFAIPRDKPLITQVSRFDKWKDPEGVIDIFREVKKEVDCRLVLCGSIALDDPECTFVHDGCMRKIQQCGIEDDVILITSENNILVNSLQQVSDVIIQRSIREGFGLSVTEALWKGRPVVASNTGGIPLQITDGENGYLLDPEDTEGFSERVLSLLDDPRRAEEMGIKGRETVRKHFLITRLMSDYMRMIGDLTSA